MLYPFFLVLISSIPIMMNISHVIMTMKMAMTMTMTMTMNMTMTMKMTMTTKITVTMKISLLDINHLNTMIGENKLKK